MIPRLSRVISSVPKLIPFASPVRSSHMSAFDDFLLPHAEDKYDGIIIDAAQLPSDVSIFTDRLTKSLGHWGSTSRRGIWLKLPLDKAAFVPIAAGMGFSFHHAEKEYVMMTNWLAAGEDRIPANASHQVGVGCVVSHAGRLLLVQEKSGPLRGTGIWKIPTGLVDAGEELAAAAVREVKEETGITAEFVKLLCFRHAHQVSFGKSDLFFLCLLKPVSFEIVHQEAEITACAWMAPEDLTEQAFFKKSPIHKLMNSIIRREIDASGDAGCEGEGMVCTTLPVGFRPGDQTLFHLPAPVPVSVPAPAPAASST